MDGDIVHARCCGVDVHKDSISACTRWIDEKGNVAKESRKFGTTTQEISAFADWLRARDIRLVAMESTGVYWRPIWNLLEGQFEVRLANSEHIRNIPGRKTDKKDGEWIAKLLQHDLVPISFIPPKNIRELRDLTRSRTKLVQGRSAVSNRLQKVLEDANIKLASVATDILGHSGRAMLEAMIKGQSDVAVLANMARGRMREKIPRLQLALAGQLTAHHRMLLRELLDQIDFLDGKIFVLEGEIWQRSKPFEEVIKLWSTIPGVDRLSAATLLAEIGPDMEQFPSAAHLSSWAGLCPSNNESAGKRKSGKLRHGNPWLRSLLCQAAWAASRSKKTYLAAQFHRLAARRGGKRANIAVAHTILVIAYHILKEKRAYQELGGDYFDRIRAAGLARYYVKRLQGLGLEVTLAPAAVRA
jgi:transposase